MQKKGYHIILLFTAIAAASCSLCAQTIVASQPGSNTYDLRNASICVDMDDHATVQLAAGFLQQDMEAVTGNRPEIKTSFKGCTGNIIIIGSLEKSAMIRELLLQKKIRVDHLKDKWEAYQVFTVSNPVKGVANALVITGSDRRGTAYGVFEFSKQLGVSPWYWWADVPVPEKKKILIKRGMVTDAPKVKYRGIFINDEAPCLSNWSREKFGGFNHRFYAKVFELMLRLKANYLWPAMWGNAFYYDDSLNIKTADEYGIVIGTSHHEPLMRAHEEWKYFGKGRKWNYDSTESGLKEYWKGGMERAWNEKIVSLGMRGDGDEPMSRETATALLERIVKDQRDIIASVTNKPASA
ncbi:MAG TPA: glycosyl hydrolase 115 family protein, partial [Chitinophagaceae bacterium]|nr:glycosyl hydrolase 115 family protein [Chitinophagaceae bacterium]